MLIMVYSVASMAVLVYDALILFGEEVDLIWKARWTFPKALYLLSRYTPFIDLAVDLYHTLAFPQPSPEACQSSYVFISWSMVIGMGLSEVVMILRIYAMRGRSKRVLYSLVTLWGILIIIGLFFSNRVAYSVTFGQLNIPGLDGMGLTGCHNLPTPSFSLAASFVSLLAMEAVIVVLTVLTAVNRWNERYQFESFDMTFKTLYFDGIFFFLCLLGFSLLNITFTLLTDNPALTPIFIAPMRVMHGILSCRMLLNIRRVAAKIVVLPLPVVVPPPPGLRSFDRHFGLGRDRRGPARAGLRR
ncbi:hypothetical protein OF83DRAFT_779615 [Amylostereum chailletii]|nr:hypothetical protein OF83DRAFT_779615 [Amylostereum chailletii]